MYFVYYVLYFVTNYGTLYGYQHISYNVHNLVHLCDYVKLWGPLDEFSAFKYENYMQTIKSKIRSSSRPLQQLINRCVEEDKLNITNVEKIYPIPKLCNIINANGEKIIKSVQCKGFYLNTKAADNCCSLFDGTTISLTKIYFKNEQIYIIGKKYLNVKSFFYCLCDSLNIGIKQINKLQYEFITVPLSDIKSKCVKLLLNDKEAVILPLLHQQEIYLWRVLILVDYKIKNNDKLFNKCYFFRLIIMGKDFAVVTFPNDGNSDEEIVSEVPSLWLRSNLTEWWWPSVKNINTFIVKQIPPIIDDPKWSLYSIKFHGYYGN